MHSSPFLPFHIANHELIILEILTRKPVSAKDAPLCHLHLVLQVMHTVCAQRTRVVPHLPQGPSNDRHTAWH